jgi:hypothetical protein
MWSLPSFHHYALSPDSGSPARRASFFKRTPRFYYYIKQIRKIRVAIWLLPTLSRVDGPCKEKEKSRETSFLQALPAQ